MRARSFTIVVVLCALALAVWVYSGRQWRGVPDPLVPGVAQAGPAADVQLETLEPGAPGEPLTRAPGAREAAAAAEPNTAGLRGRFIDAQGRGLAGAELRRVDEPGPSVRSAPDGRFEYRLPLAEDEGYAECTFEALHAEFAHRRLSAVLRPGRWVDLGEIELGPGGSIAGRVVDAGGLAVQAVELRCVPAISRPDPYTGPTLGAPDSLLPIACSDALGRFAFSGVPAGTWCVWAGGERWLWSPSDELLIEARGEHAEVVIALSPAPIERCVSIAVQDPRGAAVAHAQVRYRSARENGTARADEQGRLRLALSEPGRVDLAAVDPRGRWSEARIEGVRTGQGPLVITLAEPLSFELVVRDEGGQPVASFAANLLDLSEPGRVIGRAHTPGEHSGGRVRLRAPPEPFRLQVQAPGYITWEREYASGGSDAPVEARLRARKGLSGRVLLKDRAAPGARVGLYRALGEEESAWLGSFPTRTEPEACASTSSGPSGLFRIDAVDPGSYWLRAELDGHAPAELGPLSFSPEAGAADLLLVLHEGGALEGRILAADPIQWSGRVVGASRGDGQPRFATPAGDGGYHFEHLVPGQYLLALEQATGGSGTFSRGQPLPKAAEPAPHTSCEVHAGRVTRCDLDLTEQSVLRGFLRLAGKPLAGTAILSQPPRMPGPGGRASLDAQGGFKLLGEAPGAYELELLLWDAIGTALRLRLPVDLGPGERRLDLDLATGRVEGRVQTGAGGGGSWRLTGEPRPGWRAELDFDPDEQGEFGIDGVPAGSWRLLLFDPAGVEVRDWPVQVVSGQTASVAVE